MTDDQTPQSDLIEIPVDLLEPVAEKLGKEGFDGLLTDLASRRVIVPDTNREPFFFIRDPHAWVHAGLPLGGPLPDPPRTDDADVPDQTDSERQPPASSDAKQYIISVAGSATVTVATLALTAVWNKLTSLDRGIGAVARQAGHLFGRLAGELRQAAASSDPGSPADRSLTDAEQLDQRLAPLSEAPAIDGRSVQRRTLNVTAKDGVLFSPDGHQVGHVADDGTWVFPAPPMADD